MTRAEDDALLRRQDDLQREADEFIAALDVVDILGRAGRVVPLGSSVTGLMVWRDLDYGVDAPGLASERVWEVMRPLLARCSSLRYVDEPEDRRRYFVLRIADWKVDVSIWTAGMPPEVEAFQRELLAQLTEPVRVTILRLKDDWCSRPAYPEIVSAWQIYDAVLNDGVRTLDELDAYLSVRGLPTRGGG